MLPELSTEAKELLEKLKKFMDDYVYPNEKTYDEQVESAEDRWTIPPIIEELKAKAKEQGLWNLFLPKELGGILTNYEYAHFAEEMGRSLMAPEVFNCNAPDTGNMEILMKFGTEEQKEKWLKPLLEGEIRSCFSMTEKAVASSDARNVQGRVYEDGDHYVIESVKWWTTGALDPRCKIAIVMVKNDPDAETYRQQSMLLVPLDTPGVEIIRPLKVFGYDHAPHGHAEIHYNNVRIPKENVLGELGDGFKIAQARLGGGRIHHCMRSIGAAERALELMVERALNRVAFGTPLAEKGVIREHIAESRIEIDQARHLTYYAAHKMDVEGAKAARKEIAMAKIAAPRTSINVIDRTIQVFGGAGVTDDFLLGSHYANARTMRIVDGPDQVHLRDIGRLEIRQFEEKNK